jgi:hypothetical protein
MKRKVFIIALSIAAIINVTDGFTEDVTGSQPNSEHSKDAYLPDLADLMFLTQLRLHNLWYAGRVGHWEVADYQLKKMKHSLKDAARLYPTFENVPLANMINDEAITALSSIVDSRKSKEFGAAVGKVIDACNKCHQDSHRGFIIVTTPIDMPK